MSEKKKTPASAEGRGLRLSQNLLVLERGREEMLLVNSFEPRPLYIPRGRDYIKTYLKAVPELGSAAKVRRAFPRDHGLLEMLLDHQIILAGPASGAKSERADPARDKRMRERRSGMSLYLLLSQSCNLGCVYCLNGARTYRKDRGLMMSEAVAYRSVERCLEGLAPEGKLDIVFFGGEPLLNWPLAKKVITKCEREFKRRHPDKEIRYHLTSNLTVLPEDLVPWARKHHISFLCDIDGPAEIHDRCRPFKSGKPSHARTVANIRRLTRAGLGVALRATVTAANQDDLVEIVRHHRALGAKGSALVPVNPVNSDEDILPARMLPAAGKLLRGMAEVFQSKIWDPDDLFPFNIYAGNLRAGSRTVLGCGAPWGNTPVVDVNGEVYPCIYLVGIKRFHLGNIRDKEYPDPRVLDWMMDFLHVDVTPECRECNWRYLCGGGCPVGKLTVFDNPRAKPGTVKYGKTIRCDFSKTVIELLLWDLAQRAANSARPQARSGKPAAACEPL